jgi:DNA-binding NarL/FixJ family response regulator
MSEPQPKAKQVRLLIVDDHPVVRAGLTSMLTSYPELDVVGGVAGGAAALASIRKSRVDILLLDLRMPEMSGLETLRALKQIDSPPKVIILTSYETDEDIYQTILTGADGYLLKASSDEEILDAIRIVSSGQRYFPPYIASRFAECTPRSRLSSSDIELLELLASGANDDEISSRLKIKKRAIWAKFNKIVEQLVGDKTLDENTTTSPKITIEEVARKAGVSMSTVSRVLHNKGNHSHETRSAVMRVVREYGFELNRTAASLAMRRARFSPEGN